MCFSVQEFEVLSSPRTWGCFRWRHSSSHSSAVFPTHVGVFLSPKGIAENIARLPHARGGVSVDLWRIGMTYKSSPRTWGCFQNLPRNESARMVFPTHVGVFPCSRFSFLLCRCLPHARGGVSKVKAAHDCGRLSSPRTWGCFGSLSSVLGLRVVFPTHVGVFPWQGSGPGIWRGLPHARGGVSMLRNFFATIVPSSPRTWGCFRTLALYRRD